MSYSYSFTIDSAYPILQKWSQLLSSCNESFTCEKLETGLSITIVKKPADPTTIKIAKMVGTNSGRSFLDQSPDAVESTTERDLEITGEDTEGNPFTFSVTYDTSITSGRDYPVGGLKHTGASCKLVREYLNQRKLPTQEASENKEKETTKSASFRCAYPTSF
jgi:hypothetical protein